MNKQDEEIHKRVLSFIELIKGPQIEEVEGLIEKDDCARGIIEEIFTRGNCGRFALILKFVFPSAEIFYVEPDVHVVTKISDRYYDIMGEYVVKDDQTLIKVDEEYIIEQLLADNYSFRRRGPII